MHDDGEIDVRACYTAISVSVTLWQMSIDTLFTKAEKQKMYGMWHGFCNPFLAIFFQKKLQIVFTKRITESVS